MLTYFEGHMFLYTDACNIHSDCDLLQMKPFDAIKSIKYWIHSLNNVKMQYDTTQR